MPRILIVDDSPTCIPQAPVAGFTVDVGRILKQGGTVVKTEQYTTTQMSKFAKMALSDVVQSIAQDADTKIATTKFAGKKKKPK